MSIFKSKYFWLATLIFVCFVVIGGTIIINKNNKQIEEYIQTINQLDTLYWGALREKDFKKALEVAKEYENKGYVEGVSLQFYLYINSNENTYDINKAIECYWKLTLSNYFKEFPKKKERVINYLKNKDKKKKKEIGIGTEGFLSYLDQDKLRICWWIGATFENEEKDFENAKKWYEYAEKINEKDWGYYYYLIGRMYFSGEIVDPDYFQAMNYFKLALDTYDKKDKRQNMLTAFRFDLYTCLGWLYKNGEGTRRDLLQAKEMYGKACDFGDDKGCLNYKKLDDFILKNNIH